MVLKRQLREEGEEGVQLPSKRRNLHTNLFKGPNYARCMQEFMEPMIRRWVQEAVASAISSHQRMPPINQIESSGRRNIHLKFQNNLPRTLFTGGRITSDDGNRIEIALYDSVTRSIISSGPLSSSKVTIVALDGEFGPDDREDWSKQEFDRKTVRSREGRRPLITGESIVHLQGGVGYVGDITITDNSSWIRSRKFRLGAKLSADEVSVREGMSNAFMVKDHRGESYQKHHPPSMSDEVWRLEKIGKDGTSHKNLTQSNIRSVGDLLRAHALDPRALRSVLNVSNKQWETIMGHANKCVLDDKRYFYMTSEGTTLIFNSVYRVIDVSFDGQTYHQVDSLNPYQMRKVDELKLDAYRNLKSWILLDQPPLVARQMLLPGPASETYDNSPNSIFQNTNFLDQSKAEKGFNVGAEPESFNDATDLINSFGAITNHPSSSDSFFVQEHACPFEDNNNNNFMGSDGGQLIEGNFQVGDTPALREYGMSLSSNSGMIDIGCYSNTRMLCPSRTVKPKTRWCKVLAVVKWRILVKRNVAARKWRSFFFDA